MSERDIEFWKKQVIAEQKESARLWKIIDKKEFELQALITEREGMIAENMQRESCGQSMAYGYEHFYDVARQIRALKEAGDD